GSILNMNKAIQNLELGIRVSAAYFCGLCGLCVDRWSLCRSAVAGGDPERVALQSSERVALQLSGSIIWNSEFVGAAYFCGLCGPCVDRWSRSGGGGGVSVRVVLWSASGVALRLSG